MSLENILSVTNTISPALQSNRKDFKTDQRSVASTKEILWCNDQYWTKPSSWKFLQKQWYCDKNSTIQRIKWHKVFKRMDQVNFVEKNLLKNFTCFILEYFVSNAVWINTQKN